MAIFDIGSGKRFANSIADHIGIERNLFGTALLESDITWGHFKRLKNANITVESAAESVMMQLLYGLCSLEKKFGPQDEIEKAKYILKRGPVGTRVDDITAVEAVNSLHKVDQCCDFTNPIDILRHKLFSTVVRHYELPGGLDAARVLAVLWANAADRAMQIPDVARETQLPHDRTQAACSTLYSSSMMDRGEARDAAVYFRLNDAGLIGGRRLAFEWLHIVEKIPSSD